MAGRKPMPKISISAPNKTSVPGVRGAMVMLKTKTMAIMDSNTFYVKGFSLFKYNTPSVCLSLFATIISIA
ncbi:MAG: hypothetical protein HDR22_00870 [Lachnospiraceae bacterium]|nr:hypothetical protein [Lachnospiraceae bacterium]